MPVFIVLSRVDAYVDYTCEVEADSAQEAAEYAYYDGEGLVWEPAGTVEFDARRIYALDAGGEAIESTGVGKA